MRPWSSALRSYPAIRKVPGLSPELPPSLKTLRPWENKQCLVTAWL